MDNPNVQRAHDILDLFRDADRVENTFGKTLELTRCLVAAKAGCEEGVLEVAQRLLDNQSLLFGIPEIHVRNQAIKTAQDIVSHFVIPF